MQFIRDIFATGKAQNKPVISFEFFPPKTEEGDRALLERTLPALMTLKPQFCSVTYGAGGSTREKTLMIVDRIQRQHNLTAMAHLTCVSATKEQIAGILKEARSLGIKNILALRGDPPGPGHGGPALLANTWLEGSYSEAWPEVTRDAAGMRELFRQFSFPGGVPSHVAPQVPGSIHEERTETVEG